jgi:hypothetical protein
MIAEVVLHVEGIATCNLGTSVPTVEESIGLDQHVSEGTYG